MGLSTTPESLTEKQFKKLGGLIERELGIRMPDAKRVMLESRLHKRLRVLNLTDYDEYIERILSGDKREFIQMIDVVTTNKTDFFREADHFDVLLTTILPAAMRARGGKGLFSFWSAGCATGEEPYTLAMVLSEYAAHEPGFAYEIIASDISTRALSAAMNAVYAEEKIAPVPLSYKKKYLLKGRNPAKKEVRIKKELRDSIAFVRLNFMDETFPFEGEFDVVFCRNVIIYFDRATQKRILGTMCRYIKRGGTLFLGHSENVSGLGLPLKSIGPTMYEKL